MEYGVIVQLAGCDVRAGTLYAHVYHGVESASFSDALLSNVPVVNQA